MIRFTAFALALIGFLTLAPPVQADIEFTWTHDGRDTASVDLPGADQYLAFQVEYSIEGGPNQYIDIAPGGWTDATTRMTHREAVQTFCQQTVVARLRADYRGTQSAWSAQANGSGGDCPVPGAPTNHTVSFPARSS